MSAARVRSVLACSTLMATLGLVVHPSSAGAAPSSPVRADITGDGRSDLVVGAPWEGPLGTRRGVVFTRDFQTGVRQQVTATDTDVLGPQLGSNIKSCDLNGDRYADLAAVGSVVPEDGGQLRYGLQWFLGSPRGLQRAGQLVDDSRAYSTSPTALACGDVDGDGYDEVAVGLGGSGAATGPGGEGAVRLYPGGPTGPTITGRLTVDQEFPGLPGRSEKDDGFGLSVAFGDLDGDGFDELVAGAPSEQVGTTSPGGPGGEGAVAVLHGSASGLSTTRSEYLTGRRFAVSGFFGLAVAAGDLTGDGKDDLVVGAPNYVLPKLKSSVGAAVVFLGRTGGLRRDQVVSQADRGVPGFAGVLNEFGGHLNVGDVTGDGREDLVVGAAGQTVRGLEEAGSLTLLPGSRSGVERSRSQYLTRATPGIVGAARELDRWGSSSSVLDTDGNGFGELWVGGARQPTRAVYRVTGSRSGLVPSRAKRFLQRDLQQRPASGLAFGVSLG